ncbi:unnamed protein product [Cyclocybe aegerita]|uniref:F-box domain-containing protein n=1 Tax=Cyclocybe aegerita TaxID=1973307 RepID=A0A8S0WYQ8_CYCAE|nr:unnamed protein product [Cyclocybe aegerita]
MDLGSLDNILARHYSLPLGEAAWVTSVLRETENDLSIIAGNISLLQEATDDLKLQQATLLEQQSKCSSALSPLRTLPVEILQEIFKFACENDMLVRQDICNVCKHWRTIAYRCPSLWTTFVISKRHKPLYSPSMEQILSRIRRAGALPITLDYKHTYLPSAFLISILKSGVEGRWSSISMHVPHGSYLPFKKKERVDFTNLKTLSICLDDGHIGRCKYTFPALKEYKVAYSSPDFYPPGLQVPWSQLTGLILETGIGLEEFVQILRRCTLVERCSVWLDVDDVFHSTTFQPIKLDKIQQFSIYANAFPSGLLPVTETPLLRRFTFRIKGDYTDAFVYWEPQLIPFLRRAANTLMALELEIEDADLDELHESWIQMPLLSEIKLHSFRPLTYPVEEEFFQFLTLSRSNQTLPNLEVFALAVPLLPSIVDVPGTEELFMDFVKSRYWNDAVIQGTATAPKRKLKQAVLIATLDTRFMLEGRFQNLSTQCPDLDIRHTTSGEWAQALAAHLRLQVR